MKLSKIEVISFAKYVYLLAFFALVAGVFHPIVTGQNFDAEILGIVTLFVGLSGGVLIYKAITSKTRNSILFIIGFGLIAISLTLIMYITGRVF